MKTFTFTPKSEVKRSVQYLDRTIEFESGAFQVQEIGINPIITFQMTFESMAAEMASLEAFYMEHRKSKRFYLIIMGSSLSASLPATMHPLIPGDLMSADALSARFL